MRLFFHSRKLFPAGQDIVRKSVEKNSADEKTEVKHQYRGAESAQRQDERDEHVVRGETSEHAQDGTYCAESADGEY